jgi:hypothetical protein
MTETIEINQLTGVDLSVAEVCVQVDAFVATLVRQREYDPQAREDATAMLLSELDIWGSFRRCGEDRDLEGTSQLLNSLDYLEDILGESWLTWAIQLDDTAVMANLQQLSIDDNPALHSILDRFVGQESLENDEAELQRMLVVEEILCGDGHLSEWMDGGTPVGSLPGYIHRLAARPQFAAACIRSNGWSMEQAQGRGHVDVARSMAVRGTRCLLRDVLGVDTDLAEDFEHTLRQRIRKRNREYDPLPLSEGGGIDAEYWEETMLQFTQNVQRLGPQNTQRLYRTCGIVNFDRYTWPQLERMVALLDRDPDLLERLRSGDVTLVISDALGDYNGALNGYIDAIEDNTGMTLFFEAGDDPRDVLRPLMMLAYGLGIKPSTLVLASHGIEGWLGFGESAFYFGMRETFDTEERTSEYADWRHGEYDFRELNLGLILRNCMRPDSITLLRHVVVAACRQANRRASTGESVIESIAAQTDVADGVLVSGGEGTVALWRSEHGVQVWDHEADVEDLVYSCRRGPNGLEVTTSRSVPGLK